MYVCIYNNNNWSEKRQYLIKTNLKTNHTNKKRLLYKNLSKLVLKLNTLGAVTISWGKEFQSFIIRCEK